MNTAARSANLRAILADDSSIRKAVVDMVTIMDTTAKEDARGFRLASMLDPSQPEYTADSNAKPFKLDGQWQALLQDLIASANPAAQHLVFPTEALAVDEISIRSVRYGTSNSSKFRDSAIIFRPADRLSRNNSVAMAGIIRSIFQFTYGSAGGPENTSFYLAVQEYPPLDATDGPVDAYRKYGFAGGYLCHCEATTLHVLELSQVVSHFAMTKLSNHEGYEHLIHVLPVDRVGRPETS